MLNDAALEYLHVIMTLALFSALLYAVGLKPAAWSSLVWGSFYFVLVLVSTAVMSQTMSQGLMSSRQDAVCL